MKKKCMLAVGMLLVLSMLSGCGAKKDGPMDQVQEKVSNVEVENPQTGTMKDEYKYSGTIEPKDTVDVTASMTGTVKAVNFKEGDKVNKGDVLFTIDTKDLENTIKTNKASLASADASIQSAKTNLELANGATMQTQIENAKNAVTNAKNSIATAQTALDTAGVSVNNAKTTLDDKQNTYNINKQLFDSGGLSKQALDDSQTALTAAQNAYTQAVNSKQQAEVTLSQAKSSLENAQKSYDILVNQTSKENVTKAQDSLNTAQASRKSVQAQIEASESKLSDAVVKSPISGTVSECNVTAGAQLLTAKTPFTIVDLNTVDIQVNVSEDVVPNLKVGDSVQITIPTLSNQAITGHISEISDVSNADGTFKVKVEMSNTDGKLKAGMFAEVNFAKSTSDGAVIVPRDSVLRDGDDYYAFVIEDGKAKKVDVTIGIDAGETIEVKSGIKASDKVVTKGQTYLDDGSKVKVVSDNGTEITEATTEATTENPKAKKSKGENK